MKSFQQSNRPLIECVVNISEGRNLKALADIEKLLHVPKKSILLHSDIGHGAHRTVFTFMGSPEDVFAVLEDVISYCMIHLSISVQDGIHPRVGMVDVIPFIPIAHVDQHKLKRAAKRWAKDMYKRYRLPFYFYGDLDETQRPLSQIRKLYPDLRFDIGDDLHQDMGASCMTVRDYMAAFNVHLNTKDVTSAKVLARRLRTIRTETTRYMATDVRFLAWYIPEYDCCQISTNLYNLHDITIEEVYQLIRDEAILLDIEIEGCELIGMTPYFGLTRKAPQHLARVIEEIGLGHRHDFDPMTHILDHRWPEVSAWLALSSS